MTRDLRPLVTAWARAWHKWHDRPPQETPETVEFVANTEDWRDLVAKETALLNAVSERVVH